MDIKIRVLLIIVTVTCFLMLKRGVKRGKLRSDYMMGWLLASIGLIIISIFPQIVYLISDIVGIISPVNTVFLVIIFILIVLVYVLFNKVAELEEKQKNIIQEISIEKSNKEVRKNEQSSDNEQ